MVITIIGIVSAVALAAILPNLQSRQIREGERLVQAELASARDRAIRTGRPAGVRLIPDPALVSYLTTGPQAGQVDPTKILAASRIVPLEPAPDYREGQILIFKDASGGSSQYPAAIRTVNGYPNVPCLVVEEAMISGDGITPNAPTSWFWNIRIGDTIQFGGAGPRYTVVGPMVSINPELFVNSGPPGTTPPILGNQTWKGQGIPSEYLLLVNGRDDNGNGWIDEGRDGVDNDGNGIVDDGPEWEVERWLSTP